MPDGTYSSYEMEFYKMRHLRMVYGTALDRVSVLPQTGNETIWPLLSLDVSYLRNGGFYRSSLPPHKGQGPCAAGHDLCPLHFCGRIFNRQLLKEKKSLSLELLRLQIQLQGVDPFGLCPTVVLRGTLF